MNKLYVSEDYLKEIYYSKGLEYIIERIEGEEIIICVDTFSNMVLHSIKNSEDISKHFQ